MKKIYQINLTPSGNLKYQVNGGIQIKNGIIQSHHMMRNMYN
jgi:hypothetical protein